MIRTVLSLGTIVFMMALVATGTVAFFSDEETSTDNTFAAGAIDLLIDNDSYYNGNRCVEVEEGVWEWQGQAEYPVPGTECSTSFEPSDLEGLLFFDFDDVKPGDDGEDTISIHVDDNDAYVCMDLTLTTDDDNSSNEPELEAGDDEENPGDLLDGELAESLEFFWWADDGDNVYEADEENITDGVVSLLELDEVFPLALADSANNVWGEDGPIPGDTTRYIAKAWCLGTLGLNPVAADQGENPSVDPGVTCDGELVGNEVQTDSATLDIAFNAIQSRNNEDFLCEEGGGIGCQGDLDIMLVMDNSTSIDDDEETDMQAAGVAFMNAVGIADDGSHAGLVSFANSATLEQQLTGDLTTINNAINDPFGSGFTNLAAGIEEATDELASVRDRDDLTIPDIMIILTDGNPNLPDDEATAMTAAEAAADAARVAGIEVYVVGIGDDVDATFLMNEIADDTNHYFAAAEFEDLEDILVALANCEEPNGNGGENGGGNGEGNALFFDNFGTGNTDSTFDEDPTWEEGGAGAEKRNSAGGGDESISDGDGGRKAAMAGPDGWICRSIDATGFNSLALSYSWRGDSDAEAGDEGLVEYATGGTCAAPTGLTNIATHPLTTTVWTDNNNVDLSVLDGTNFLLRFRADSDAAGEDFRIDAVELTGTPNP